MSLIVFYVVYLIHRHLVKKNLTLLLLDQVQEPKDKPQSHGAAGPSPVSMENS